MPDRVFRNPALGQRLLHIGLHQFQHVVRAQALINVLVRNHNVSCLDRLPVFVFQGHLALLIWSQRLFLAGMACFRQQLQNPLRVV